MFLNLFRNILLSRQMFPSLHAETFWKIFPQQCFLVHAGVLKETKAKLPKKVDFLGKITEAKN